MTQPASKPASALAAGMTQVLETASKRRMWEPKFAAPFWAVVQACLVQFHSFSRGAAEKTVTDLRRRLRRIKLPPAKEGQHSFRQMIYHEEPWYIACNLAENELPLDERNRDEYERVLRKNHLA